MPEQEIPIYKRKIQEALEFRSKADKISHNREKDWISKWIGCIFLFVTFSGISKHCNDIVFNYNKLQT